MGEGFSKAVLAIQCRLANYANNVRDHVFHNLYSLIQRRDWLEQALDAVLDNSGSKTAGVDGITKRNLFEIDEARAKFLDELQEELKAGNYHPRPVRRKWIPKRRKGEYRPIGIPTFADRVVQMLLKMVLEPIFECDFLCNSNGFRPNRSTLECVLPLYQYGNVQKRYNWVIEGDILGCFDNIDHDILMKSVQQRIGDKRILSLIWKFLKAPVEEESGIRTKTTKGTPQGSVFSPLLCNVYLNQFDQYWFEQWGRLSSYYQRKQQRLKKDQANCVLFRYADDFILCAKGTKEQVEHAMNDIRQFFQVKLKLNLSHDKTRVVSVEDGFEFLGFKISQERLGKHNCIRIRPTQHNVMRLKDKLQRMLGKRADRDDVQIKIQEINRVTRGWANYYRTVNSYEQFVRLDYFLRQLFIQWYRRKSKRKKGVRHALKKLFSGNNSNVITVQRDSHIAELFKLSSMPSEHTALNVEAVWKFRSIKNPYLEGNWHTNATLEAEDPLDESVRSIHPIDRAYGEIYLFNRLKAFRRDGFKCRKCSRRENLAAHHISPVPKGGRKFDVYVVHSVENLLTLCPSCHMNEHSNHIHSPYM